MLHRLIACPDLLGTEVRQRSGKVHARLFQEALANLEAKELAEIFVCPICGYTVAGEPPDNCPICNAKKKLFRRID